MRALECIWRGHGCSVTCKFERRKKTTSVNWISQLRGLIIIEEISFTDTVCIMEEQALHI